MADLLEASKVYLAPDGTVVIQSADGNYYAGSKIIDTNRATPFRYGVNVMKSGSLIATIAHGLAARPSLILLTSLSSTGAFACDGADTTYIRARLSATVGADVSFAWLAGN